MIVNLSPELEANLIEVAAFQGRAASDLVSDVVVQYLDDEAGLNNEFTGIDWTDRGVLEHIEKGFKQAERGELMDGAQFRLELQARKALWRQTRETPGA